jgi:hypothetical protein
MRRSILIGSAVAWLAGAAAAASPPVRALEPSSQWVLDYAEERCTLTRNFGSGENSLLLQIDSFGSWNGFRMTLIGKAVPRANVPSGKGGFRLTRDEKSRDAALLLGIAGKDKLPAASFTVEFVPSVDLRDWQRLSDEEKAAYAVRVEQPQSSFDRSVETIWVAFGRGKPVDLHVGSMAGPLAAMRACVDDLYKSWKLDPVVQRSLSRLARPLPSTVRHVQADYPGAPLMNGASAFVPVRLLVDADGRAGSCVVQSATPDAPFRQAVCDNLAGKFEPARDAAGKPVASMYHTSVIYLVGG